MNPSVVADTGPLYAAVDRHDEHHVRAQRELKRLARNRRAVIIAYPTLLETYTLVLYRLGERVASFWLSDILAGASLINPTPEDYREAIKKVLAFTDQRITLFDATTAAVASRLGVEVWTYDHHFDVMQTAIWR